MGPRHANALHFEDNMKSQSTAPWRALMGLLLFGVSFGYVEAVVETSLRIDG